MFTITRQADYGLRLMVALAENKKKKPLSLRKFAEQQGISFLFLQRLARKLRRFGLIKSTRGPEGGYILAKNPRQIKLKDIFMALQGEVAIMKCMSRKGGCPAIYTCSTKKVLGKLNKEINKHLRKITLSDF